MPFTPAEIENVANSTINFHMDRGKVLSQSIQEKPLYEAMTKAEKEFPGGTGDITVRVKGIYSTTIQGFSGDDTVSYGNPTNIRTAKYPWKLIHSGINFTMDELLRAGISVTDTMVGKTTSQHTDAELVQLVNLIEDKIEDMKEGTERGMNDMFWLDGSQDPELSPGVTSFIVDDPTADIAVGGLGQVLNTWWRNRASLTINLGSGPESGAVLNTLQYEVRQLRRYGGLKRSKWLAGSDMMDRIEKELKAQGYYTQTGWANKGRIDGSVSDLAFKGNDIDYDPTLDDLGWSKRLYVVDTDAIKPMVVEGEADKQHAPARPENVYAFFRAQTWVGGLTCNRRNSSGVYAFA